MLDVVRRDRLAGGARAAATADRIDLANPSSGRKLAIVWGVHSVIAADARDQDDMVDRACAIAFRDGFADVGKRVIIVAGVPFGTPGATNMVRIAFVNSATGKPAG